MYLYSLQGVEVNNGLFGESWLGESTSMECSSRGSSELTASKNWAAGGKLGD